MANNISMFNIFYIIIAFIFLSLFSPHNANHHYQYTALDCIEDGICKEGLVLKDTNGPVVINKDYCLNTHNKWDDKRKVCLRG